MLPTKVEVTHFYGTPGKCISVSHRRVRLGWQDENQTRDLSCTYLAFFLGNTPFSSHNPQKDKNPKPHSVIWQDLNQRLEFLIQISHCHSHSLITQNLPRDCFHMATVRFGNVQVLVIMTQSSAFTILFSMGFIANKSTGTYRTCRSGDKQNSISRRCFKKMPAFRFLN